MKTSISFGYTQTEKYCKKIDNVIISPQKPWHCDMERYDNIASWVLAICRHHQVKQVFMEDYIIRVGSNTGQLIENAAITRLKLWKEGIPYYLTAPNTLKKAFTR